MADDGLWYLTRTGVEQAHRHTRGAGITIGVIDGVVDPDAPDLRGADLTVHEPSFCATAAAATAWAPATSRTPAAQHATGMAALVVGTGTGSGPDAGIGGVAPAARVVSYAVLTSSAQGTAVPAACPPHAGEDRGWLEGAIDAAIADGVDILSISMTEDQAEPGAIARALHAGIVVVAAQAHGGTGAAYPASSGGVLAVESSGPDGRVASQATVDPANTVVAPGEDVRQPSPDLSGHVLESGSSTATAFTAGVLALAWSAHPTATGNQVLQALVRSTDRAGERSGDEWGLGAVDVAALLAQDPTSLPDVNPLVRDGVAPSAAQIADPPPAAPGPAPSTDATTTGPGADASAGSGSHQTLTRAEGRALATSGGGAHRLPVVLFAVALVAGLAGAFPAVRRRATRDDDPARAEPRQP